MLSAVLRTGKCGLRKYDIPDLVWDGDEMGELSSCGKPRGGIEDSGPPAPDRILRADGSPFIKKCEHEWTEEKIIIAGTHKDWNKYMTDGLSRGDPAKKRNEQASHGQFCLLCPAWRGQLGLEPTIDLYLSHLLQVTKEIWRVLRKDGTFGVNIGDSYAGGGGHAANHANPGLSKSASKGLGHSNPVPLGLKPKDLCLIPFRLALALQAQGWWVRSDIIWSKKNPMPESVKDRPTRSHEYIFLLTKSERYFWDQGAVMEAFADDRMGNPGGGGQYAKNCPLPNRRPDQQSGLQKGVWNEDRKASGHNIRSVWSIATQPYPEAHYATFPEALVERCIKAGCPKGGVVLDPFAGSGTVQRVAEKLNRIGIGFDLGYEDLREKRLKNNQKEIFG